MTPEERQQTLGSGGTRVYNRVGWAGTYLRKAGLLEGMGPGRLWVMAGTNFSLAPLWHLPQVMSLFFPKTGD